MLPSCFPFSSPPHPVSSHCYISRHFARSDPRGGASHRYAPPPKDFGVSPPLSIISAVLATFTVVSRSRAALRPSPTSVLVEIHDARRRLARSVAALLPPHREGFPISETQEKETNLQERCKGGASNK
ncbi:hypothetical protein MUK42_15633 [Musa troglodytarum]|uniref:Uncharacterized protein n=1 Tax=Musa troglodytarum TaxID=320322 RepID=A0A9E7HY22_9LILI|nr:hypothetical protein MUK42_15633 [Musa troglodytarum]